MKLVTPKLLEENIGATLYNIGIVKDFLRRILFTQESRSTTEKWDLIKLNASAQMKKQLIG